MKNAARNFLAIVCLNCAFASPAFAYDWQVISAKVTVVEPTYMPTSISFQINQNAGSCPAGTWLVWNGQGTTDIDKKDNSKAVLAALMTAVNSNKSINVFGFNSGCKIQFIHLLKD
ncbi:hypothetical protein [Merismopedia glauca]|uniref:Uncharacterized protein n=1 Tax=Merismopedia glauca CCAP 1448/3 TaxID=1296344 RepID=A0A2T1BYM3_9CYAN|nr:hypothetical protein [Merismopedia glauca]PSB00973.1 hypothetical protein C7B64_20750 [Merismopedia glauca CCAP 1448/3]